MTDRGDGVQSFLQLIVLIFQKRAQQGMERCGPQPVSRRGEMGERDRVCSFSGDPLEAVPKVRGSLALANRMGRQQKTSDYIIAGRRQSLA